MGCEHTELGELYKYMVPNNLTPEVSTSAESTTIDMDLSSSATSSSAEVGLGLASVSSVPIQMAAGFEHYTSDTGGQLHDAGWDAYLTGSIFYQQARSIGSVDALVTRATLSLPPYHILLLTLSQSFLRYPLVTHTYTSFPPHAPLLHPYPLSYLGNKSEQ